MMRPHPIDAPVDYDVRDLFFSTTDLRGVIRSGNDVFVRVSGYSRDELEGKPHSIIRHPDVPRSVFRLVWQFLKSGQPVVGYVKNLSKSGRYYWVLAFIQPIEDGYLSIRIKPTSAVFPVVRELYKKMLQAEERGGMDAGAACLVDALRSLGFSSYETFMSHALNEELKSADLLVAQESVEFRGRSPAAGAPRTSSAASFKEILSGCQAVFDEIGRVNQGIFRRLESFTSTERLLMTQLRTVLELRSSLGRVSINTAIQSERIGARGACLSVVAGLIQKTSVETAEQARLIEELATSLASEAQQVSFNIGSAKIQVEMIRRFIQELIDAETDDGASLREELSKNCVLLVQALELCTGVVNDSMLEFARRLHQLDALVRQLEEQVMTLEVARKSGVIEARRIGPDGESFNGLLEHMGAMIRQESERLASFTKQVHLVIQAARECESVGAIVSRQAEKARGLLQTQGRYDQRLMP